MKQLLGLCVSVALAWDSCAQSADDVQQMRALIEAQNKTIEALSARVSALEAEKVKPAVEPSATLPASPASGAAGTAATAGPPKPDKIPLNASWSGKDGLTFESEAKGADKKSLYQVKIGGRFQTDFAWFENSEDFDIIGVFYPQYGLNHEQDGTEIRRARLHMIGKLGTHLSFKAEYDFAANSPGDDAGKVQDAFVSYDGIPYVGSVRLGHFKEPFGLEEVQTDNATSFMETSLIRPFLPGRNVGIMATNAPFKGRMSWAAGVFRETDNWPSDNDSDDDRGWQVTGRVTGTPWYQDGGRRMFHLGVSGTHRNLDGPGRFRAKPEANLANSYADTGSFRIDTADAIGLEASMNVGPWWAQGEYVYNVADAFEIGNVGFNAYYFQTGWIISGEHRPYKTSDGTFDIIIPRRPLHWGGGERGFGAWEIAARYSHLDLDDEFIRGGRLTDYTLGLHWYPTANTRVMLDYVHSDVENDLYEGGVDILQTRFQLHF